MSNWITPMRNLGRLPLGRPAATVTLPKLQCMLGILLLSVSIIYCFQYTDLECVHRCNLMHMTAHRGCMVTVRQSALKADSGQSGRKSFAALENQTCAAAYQSLLQTELQPCPRSRSSHNDHFDYPDTILHYVCVSMPPAVGPSISGKLDMRYLTCAIILILAHLYAVHMILIAKHFRRTEK